MSSLIVFTVNFLKLIFPRCFFFRRLSKPHPPPHPAINPLCHLLSQRHDVAASWYPSVFFAWRVASFLTGLFSLCLNPWEAILYPIGTGIFLEQRLVNSFSKSQIANISDLMGPYDLCHNLAVLVGKQP